MTTPLYPGGSPPVTLLDRFENLKRNGWLPSQAVEIMGSMYLAGHFITPFPPCSSPFLSFRLGPNDSLIVDSDEGGLDPNKIPTRDPDKSLDPAPVPFKLPVMELGAERDKLLEAAMVRGKSRTIEKYLVEGLGTLKGSNEAEAAKWLALKLTPDDEVTRETYREECMGKFGLSEVGYEERVWYAARYLAGLPRERKSGAPKGPRKASTTKKPRKLAPK